MGGIYLHRGGGKPSRSIGLVLMVVGIVLLLISVPSWMWASVLGILLTSIGFLIWRFL